MTSINNVHTLNSDIEYQLPDVSLVNSSAESMLELKAIATLAFNHTQYLPSLYKKADPLHAEALKSRTSLNDYCTTLEVEMEHRKKRLDTYKAEYDPEGSADDSEENLHFREQELTNAIKYATEQHKELSALLDKLDVSFTPTITEGYVKELELERQAHEQSIQKSEAVIETLTAEHKILSDAMRALEKTNFADIAQDTLLTVENVSALSLAMPEIEMIKMAIDHMKKVLEGISKTLNYLSMFDERARLMTRIKGENDTIKDTQATKFTTTEKIKLVNAINSLYSNFSIIVGEFRKVESSVGMFVKLNTTQGDLEARESTFITAVPYFIDYLKKTY